MSNKVTKTELDLFNTGAEKPKSYTNGELTVYWRSDLCIHSANCLIELPEVFDSGRRPWINIKAASVPEIIRTVNTCPSRALVFKLNGKTPAKKPARKKKIVKFARVQVLNNGPALITGNFIVRDANKKKIRISGDVVALCRCGGTKSPPFCDGTHRKIGFKG
jgi:uncharacterized Fe-S cluster protein YjdI